MAPRPFLKWAGGKTQLLEQFVGLYPPAGSFKRYIEPFVGSGAVFFHISSLLLAESALLADSNEELINVYCAVRDDVEGLIRRLRRHKAYHSKEHFYSVRAQQRGRLDPTARAARLIYLNKTCFNGLYRVNSRGEFNVPMGSYADPPILDEENLRQASLALRRVKLRMGHFTKVLSTATAGDFVYLDPPYHPVSNTSYFTSYTRGSFRIEDQRELARVFRELDRKGCALMLSNSDTPFIKELYEGCGYQFLVSARRNINSKADKRGHITELVVMNYKPTGLDDLHPTWVGSEVGRGGCTISVPSARDARKRNDQRLNS